MSFDTALPQVGWRYLDETYDAQLEIIASYADHDGARQMVVRYADTSIGDEGGAIIPAAHFADERFILRSVPPPRPRHAQ